MKSSNYKKTYNARRQFARENKLTMSEAKERMIDFEMTGRQEKPEKYTYREVKKTQTGELPPLQNKTGLPEIKMKEAESIRSKLIKQLNEKISELSSKKVPYWDNTKIDKQIEKYKENINRLETNTNAQAFLDLYKK